MGFLRKAEPQRFLPGEAHGRGHASAWVDYSNQDSCGMAHYFNRIGFPWLSQKWVRRVHQLVFSDTSPYGGYNGDEDQGQMGALSALMAMGLFQFDGGCAVHPTYDITAPVFDQGYDSPRSELLPFRTSPLRLWPTTKPRKMSTSRARFSTERRWIAVGWITRHLFRAASWSLSSDRNRIRIGAWKTTCRRIQQQRKRNRSHFSVFPERRRRLPTVG